MDRKFFIFIIILLLLASGGVFWWWSSSKEPDVGLVRSEEFEIQETENEKIDKKWFSNF